MIPSHLIMVVICVLLRAEDKCGIGDPTRLTSLSKTDEPLPLPGGRLIPPTVPPVTVSFSTHADYHLLHWPSSHPDTQLGDYHLNSASFAAGTHAFAQ
jgi:hypothetical protein